MSFVKSIIITGGASGIGLGITHHFASQPQYQPSHIAILDVDASSFPSLHSSLSTTYPHATLTFLRCDVSSWASVSSSFAQVFSATRRIDVVIANAGISQEAKLIDDNELDEPTEPSLRTLGVNLTGCIYTVKLAIHYMRRNPLPITNGPLPTTTTTTSLPSRGKIICTASNAGIYPFPVAPIYAASKAGVINLVRSLALPLQKHSIQINALAPAVLETNIAPDKALFKSMKLTPMETLCRGVDVLLSHRAAAGVEMVERTGEVVEVHGEKVTVREVYGWVDEDSRTNVEEFWKLGYA